MDNKVHLSLPYQLPRTEARCYGKVSRHVSKTKAARSFEKAGREVADLDPVVGLVRGDAEVRGQLSRREPSHRSIDID